MAEARVLDKPDQIACFLLCTLRGGLMMEIGGMHRHGTSSYALLKNLHGYTGSKLTVYKAVCADIKRMQEALLAEESIEVQSLT